VLIFARLRVAEDKTGFHRFLRKSFVRSIFFNGFSLGAAGVSLCTFLVFRSVTPDFFPCSGLSFFAFFGTPLVHFDPRLFCVPPPPHHHGMSFASVLQVFLTVVSLFDRLSGSLAFLCAVFPGYVLPVLRENYVPDFRAFWSTFLCNCVSLFGFFSTHPPAI